MGGAVNRVDAEATAFAERSAPYMVSIDGNWEDPGRDAEIIASGAIGVVDDERIGTGGVYLNFTGLEGEATTTSVNSPLGRNLGRLASIKATYDPANLFRLNNNHRPGVAGRTGSPAGRAGPCPRMRGAVEWRELLTNAWIAGTVVAERRPSRIGVLRWVSTGVEMLRHVAAPSRFTEFPSSRASLLGSLRTTVPLVVTPVTQVPLLGGQSRNPWRGSSCGLDADSDLKSD